MQTVFDIVNEMTNDQVLDSKLLDLSIDHYEYLTTEESQEETNEILFLFLLLSSRRVDIAIEEGDKIDVLLKVIETRLEQIIDILGFDDYQILNSLNYINEDVLKILIIFFHSFDNRDIFYKIIEYIMDMDENNENLSICVESLRQLMENIDGYNDEIMLRTIIEHENWIQLKNIIDDILTENPEFLKIIKEEYSDLSIFDYY